MPQAAAEADEVAEAENAAALVVAAAAADLALAGGEDEGGGSNAAIAKGAKVTVEDSFTAMTRGFEVVLGEYGRAGSFLREWRDVRQLLFAHAARHQNALAGEFELHISDAIISSIESGFCGRGKRGRKRSCRHRKSSFPNGPLMLGQNVPVYLPPPEFPRTRSVTDRIGGVQQQLALQSVMGGTKKRGVEREEARWGRGRARWREEWCIRSSRQRRHKRLACQRE